MECILLGTGGMMPMPHRLLASMAVRLNGRIYLFDAGEGAQLAWKKLRLGVRGLRFLAVTHLHADHCLGIPGLLMLRAQMEDPEPLTILGPPGVRSFVEHCQNALEFHTNYPILFREWADGNTEPAYEDDLVRVFWHPLKHTRFCLGYRLEELERAGKFDPRRAEALGIPKGPLWGKLQRGEMVVAESGRTISPDQVLGPSRRGRHVCYVVDTRPVKAIYRLCHNVDIAFVEGMFLPDDARHAEDKGHMTVVDAARIARRSRSGRAVLVHISPRYDNDELHRLESAAKAQFEHAQMGRDLDIYPVPFTE